MSKKDSEMVESKTDSNEKKWIEKRYFRLFTAEDKIKLLQKVNAFSRENAVKIINYETDSLLVSENQMLIFYSKLEEIKSQDSNEES